MQTRPKNLNLFTIHFPIPAIVSILHRISGFFLFLIIPLVLWGLMLSLTFDGFETLQQWFATWYVKVVIWGVFLALLFHFIAGIRHLLMDIGIGSSLTSGRRSAWLTIIFFVLFAVYLGVWLCRN